MISSFRLRLALFAALLTGLSLVAFGLGSWWLIRDIKIERIDKELRSNAEREVSRTRSPAGWQGIEARLVSDLGIRNGSDLIMLVQEGAGETVYRSAHWPAGFGPELLPWPQPRTDRAEGRLGLMPFAEARAEDRPPPEDSPPGHPPPRRERPPEDRQAPGAGAGPDSAPPGARPTSAAISRTIGGHLWLIGLASTDRARVALAVDAHVIDVDMQGIRNAFLIALPFALLLIGLGGWIFSSRALRPVTTLTAAARRVTAKGLDQRISAQGEDREFVELIEVFNSMLARLERSFQQARRFSADAAHELKTPLAILQGQLERAIHAAEAGSPMQQQLTGILDEVRRLSTISRKLLLLSQADAGRLSVHREVFDLSAALADLVDDTCMLAPRLKVTAEIQPGLTANADASLLRQALHNLVSNAIKYNVEHGWIRVTAARAGQVLEIRVANSASGIPAGEREKIFERFYRADPAHGRQVEGVGLGLSVSREIARAHGGDVVLLDAGRAGEVCFAIRLPAG